MQRLLRYARWDTDAVRDDLRAYAGMFLAHATSRGRAGVLQQSPKANRALAEGGVLVAGATTQSHSAAAHPTTQPGGIVEHSRPQRHGHVVGGAGGKATAVAAAGSWRRRRRSP
ncbi:hypothetical protein GCM10010383_55470 [Streptomyces lomondensis]|uniref:Transposase n=1 Tax=Streptomyces lomondensis TaxID=68229 RepID=A0ABQ2XHT0_9ACTN|nr:hypothetical protein GCM10010383_55470 [Streptomyces lomondensis]